MSTKKMGKAWLIAIICIIASIFISGNNDKVAATMVLLMKDFGVGATEGGLLYMVIAVIGTILAIPAGALMMKTGARTLGLIAIIAAAVGAVAGAFANTFGFLLGSRIFDAIGFALIGVAIPSVITYWFPPEKRGLPMGLWSTWVGIGYIYIMLTANTVITEDAHSWTNVWWVSATVLVIVGILFFIFVKTPANDGNEQVEAQQQLSKGSLKDGMKSVSAWFLTISMFMLAMGVITVSTFLPTYCQLELGMSLIEANSYTSIFSFGNVVGSLIMGFLLTKLKNHTLLLVINAVLAALVFVASFEFPVSMILPFMIIGGIIMQFLYVSIFTIAPYASSSPATIPITMSLLIMGINLAGFCPALAGYVIDTAGFHGLTVLCAVISVIMIIAAIGASVCIKKKMATDEVVRTNIRPGLS